MVGTKATASHKTPHFNGHDRGATHEAVENEQLSTSFTGTHPHDGLEAWYKHREVRGVELANDIFSTTFVTSRPRQSVTRKGVSVEKGV